MKSAVSAGVVTLLTAFAAHAQSRGELLYSTHCIGCHTTEMHWRDGRAATDWRDVVAQVGKWQSANSLSWNEQDVLAVARYLNESFYHFDPSASLPADSTGAARP
jgi:mono/diheme cytochrome c family protein